MKIRILTNTYERTFRAHQLGAALVSLLVLGACASESGGLLVGTCERDPAQLEAGRSCVRDEHCPCGAHCESGVCRASCTSDSECGGGEVCDDFGRCRGENATSLLPAVDASATVRPFAVQERTLTLAPEAPVGGIHVAVAPETPRIQVVATPGVQVTCPGASAPARSCEIDSPASGSTTVVVIVIEVHVSDDGDGTQPSVEVHSGSHSESVSVDTSPVTPTPQPLQGVYEGSARLMRMGLDDGATTAPAPPAAVVVPLEAEVFGESSGRVLRLRERVPVLTADGELVGPLGDGDPLTLSFPRALLFDGSAHPQLPSESWADFVATQARFDGASGSLSFTLEQRVGGLTPAPSTPTLTWSVALTRRGDPSGDAAPPVPGDYEPALDVARGVGPSGWEDIFREALPGFAPALALQAFARAGSAWTGTLNLELQASTGFRTLPDVGEIPCAWAGLELDVRLPSCVGAATTIAVPDADLCDEIAAAYHCEVITRAPVAGDPVSFAVPSSSGVGSCGASSSLVSAVRGVATRSCRVVLPRTPSACAEGALCAGDASAVGILNASLDPVRGDATCEGGDRGLATAAMQNAALAPTDPARLPTSAVFDACLSDIARLDSTPPMVASHSGDLARLLDESAACIDAVRWLVAYGYASQDARDAVYGVDLGAATTPPAERLTHRLAQQWLSVHAFIASEAAQRERLAEIVRRDPGSGLPPARELLEASASGWDRLMHPRIFAPLAAMSGATIARPDYRSGFFGHEEQPGDVQAEGLSVSLGETLVSQLRLLDTILERAERRLDDAPAADTSALLRRALPMLALRAQLGERARLEEAIPAWQARDDQVGAQLSLLLPRVIARTLRVESRRPPVSATDLPLYFLGDEVGAGGRFSAVSDFLLGSSPADAAWAPTLTAQAREAFDGARAAYDAQQDRRFALLQSGAAQTAAVEGIEGEYGGALDELCGPADGSWLDVGEFTAGRCFRGPEPACQLDAEAYLVSLSPQDVRYQLCLGSELAGLLGSGAGFRDPSVQDLAQTGDCSSLSIGPCTEGDACLTCGTRVVPISASSLQVPLGSVTAEALTSAHASCRASLPMARQSLPALPRPSASCLSGSLAETWLAAQGASLEVELARSELQERIRSYDIAMTSCNRIVNDNMTQESLRSAHLTTMTVLGSIKLAADITANVSASVKDCSTAIAAADPSAKGIGAGAIACGGAVVEGIARSVSDGMAFGMEEATRRYEASIDLLQEEQDAFLCANDARQELVGVDTATLRIQRAILDQISATVALQNQLELTDGLWSEGRERRERAMQGGIVPPEDTYYLDARLVTFERRMALARRAVALAVRAVEYEYQESSENLGLALRAETPDELETVLSSLWSAAGTRTIGGSRPAELKVVLSLRDELMRLVDHSNFPSTEHRLDEAQRFRILLASRRFASYGPDGAYLGQRIPFQIAPAGRVMPGEPLSIPVLAGRDCAERIWSVNASVLGDAEALYSGSETSFVRIDLLKSNSFYSQWCDASTRATPVQVASVEPGRNLFRIPGYGSDVGMSAAARGTSFARARMEAFFNVDRRTLESDEYANGDSSELAARGLYGEYALFIPAEVLSVPSESGERTDGLVLDAIDDILIRLDYVSVARP